jgi:hypothetical protein
MGFLYGTDEERERRRRLEGEARMGDWAHGFEDISFGLDGLDRLEKHIVDWLQIYALLLGKPKHAVYEVVDVTTAYNAWVSFVLTRRGIGPSFAARFRKSHQRLYWFFVNVWMLKKQAYEAS